MFWIKKLKPEDETGYLYLRKTVYIRDKRSHKRTPNTRGDRRKTSERGKYSKKRDFYCGKIEDRNPVKLVEFKDYLKKLNFEHYKETKDFDTILDDFRDYLLFIHDISKEEYNSKKKTAYLLAEGFLCKETLDYLREFNLRKGYTTANEFERFYNRAKDASIFDEEIIMTLFLKLMPDYTKEIKAEIKKLEKHRLETQQTSNFRDYMRGEHSKH